jgi:pyruvate/2-oxoglutarate dehydrogenase complex dihydrolipoamide acyltransferase (E2) component
MSIVEIRIPQMGEGLQEARLLRLLKQPGERVAKDELLFEIETDKAILEIESPAEGVLEAWLADEEDTLPIGAVIGRLRTAQAAAAETSSQEPASSPSVTVSAPLSTAPQTRPVIGNQRIPPRTRAYAREKGVSEEALYQLAAQSGGKLLPEAIDRYLQSPQLSSPAFAQGAQRGAAGERFPYTQEPLPAAQRALVYRMQRGVQTAVPATLEMILEWSAIEQARERLRQTLPEDRQPTQFLLFAWCVVQASKSHPRFRSTLAGDGVVRRYENLHLGIAVARPEDALTMACVHRADALTFEAFIAEAKSAIQRAREGEDQAHEAMQISLTSLAQTGARRGIPVLVPPAVATLFIGTPYPEAAPLPDGTVGFRTVANMTMTFDHRLINGIGAADFLQEVQRRALELQKEWNP